jgi:hypothetical protein
LATCCSTLQTNPTMMRTLMCKILFSAMKLNLML